MEVVNKILFGNCIELMDDLPEDKIQLILTDPPYSASGKSLSLVNNKTGGPYHKINEKWDEFDGYQDYYNFTKEWTKKADRTLNKKGTIMVCCSYHNIGEVIMSLKELDYKFLNIITWKKTNPMPSIVKRTFTYSTEFIVWFAKSSGWTFNYEKMKKYAKGKQLRDVWEFPLCQGAERIKRKNGRAAHPTQKPLKLFQRLIEAATNPGDIVLDPFIGAGTTAIASIKLDRQWIGIENNHDYIEIAEKRINEHLDKHPKQKRKIEELSTHKTANEQTIEIIR
jgi:site-specific DNA-methyltransferase (adenine-specific)